MHFIFLQKIAVVFLAISISCSYAQGQSVDTSRLNFEYKYLFDTLNLKKKVYQKFSYTDVAGNKVERDSINDRPCFIYYFMAHCAPCSFEMPIMNQLYNEFKDKIDFVAFTPIPKDEIVDYYPKGKAPLFPIISVNKEYFKTGFPTTYIVDARNKIRITQHGGSRKEEGRNAHYQILKEWCIKVINENSSKAKRGL